MGGGVNDTNAKGWIERGAEKVIVTSFLFSGGELSLDRVNALHSVLAPLGEPRQLLAIDLSCRKRGDGGYFVVMNG